MTTSPAASADQSSTSEGDERDDASARGGGTLRVGLLGLGTVGGSVHQLLAEHAEDVFHATGRRVDVVGALVRDSAAPRTLPGGIGAPPLVEDVEELLARDPDVLVEAMGGLDPTLQVVLACLERGVPVVTANKQLVARHGTELFAAAEQAGAQLRLEASVCGAIPIVRMLRESLAATRVDSMLGILNGTTNFILSSMESTGASLEDALAEAQRLGYAEPDPTEDVTGADAAAKLAILAGIAFRTTVEPDEVPTTGLEAVSAADVAAAAELGCRIRLLGRAALARDEAGEATGMVLEVTPTLVPEAHPLAGIRGATNAVLVDGVPFGRLVVQGAGAGGPETASALAGDLVSVAGSRPTYLARDPHVAHLPMAPPEASAERTYARLVVPDRPGVLASVAGALAAHDVSIERVVQHRATGEGSATLVLVTHPTVPGRVADALAAIEATSRTTMPMLDDAEA